MKKFLLVLIASVVCATALTHGSGSQPRGGGALPYKVYTALLTQQGEDGPVVTVLEPNTIGEIVWSVNSSGLYEATLEGAFTVDKTYCNVTGGLVANLESGAAFLQMFRHDGDTVRLRTFRLDGVATAAGWTRPASVEIRVYP